MENRQIGRGGLTRGGLYANSFSKSLYTCGQNKAKYVPPPPGGNLLLETGDKFTLEDSSGHIILESTT